MKNSLVLILLLGAFTNTNALAFLNIEALRQEKGEPGKLKGSTGVRLNDSRGNVDKRQVRANTLNMVKNGSSSYLLLAEYLYGKSLGREDSRQGHVHFRYTRNLTDTLSWESFSQLEFNKFQDLTLRALIGTGGRIAAYQSDEQSLFFGVGAFYERENLEDLPDPSNPRGNTYISYLWKHQMVTMSSTLYYQPNIEDLNDTRLRFNAGIETVFLGQFSQQLDYTLTHDSRPPYSIKKTDAMISAGLAYRY